MKMIEGNKYRIETDIIIGRTLDSPCLGGNFYYLGVYHDKKHLNFVDCKSHIQFLIPKENITKCELLEV